MLDPILNFVKFYPGPSDELAGFSLISPVFFLIDFQSFAYMVKFSSLTMQKTPPLDSSHMSFSDLPLLETNDSATATECNEILTVTETYTREFFDKELKGAGAPMLNDQTKLKYVEFIKVYAH